MYTEEDTAQDGSSGYIGHIAQCSDEIAQYSDEIAQYSDEIVHYSDEIAQ